MDAVFQLYVCISLLICSVQVQANYPIVCNSHEEACIQYPAECSQSLFRPQPCLYIATWRSVTGGYEIELGGQIGNEKGYIGLAFSKDDKIGDDFVVTCVKEAGNSDVKIYATYNDVNENKNMFTKQDMISKKKGYYKNFFKDGKWNSAIVECRFKLLTSSSIVSPSDHPKMSMLLDKVDPEVYPIAITSSGDPIFNGEGMSRPVFVMPMQKRKLSVFGTVERSTHGLAKAHGCLMVIAWVLCASVGIILARYYKLQWPSHKLNNEDTWFQVHRGLMATCVALTLLSFILIFIDVRGYSGLRDFPDYLHPILGIVIMILTIINPFISLLRCKPEHKDRPWFNWIHWLVGTVAYVLAVLNMFLGLRLTRAGEFHKIDFHIWILVIFVLFQFIVEIILEVHTLYHWHRNKRRWRKFHEDIRDYHQTKSAMLQPQARPQEPRPAGYNLRTFLLILHAVVAAAVAFILFIVIIVY